MIAAIYVRRSTEQNLSEDAKSVKRQTVRARAFAEKRGWTVDGAHAYEDDGVRRGARAARRRSPHSGAAQNHAPARRT
jgi:DNA invertase Pin-like site-specific DNA recombinase